MYSAYRYLIIFMALASCPLYGMHAQNPNNGPRLLNLLNRLAQLTIPSERIPSPKTPSNGNDSEDEDIKITGTPYPPSTTPSIPNNIKK